MSASYDILSYQQVFKQQVLELQTGLWSSDVVRNEAYFEWKHEHNPYIKAPLLYLATYEGRVVGIRSFFGVRWEAGSPSQVLDGLYADDLIIAPDHRNRGLISRIMGAAFEDLARRGFEYVFNLSAGPVTFISSLSMGWRSAGSIQSMRVPRLDGTWKSHVRRFATRLPRAGRAGSRFRSHRGQSLLAEIDTHQIAGRFEDAPSVVFATAPRVDSMSRLVSRIGSDGRIRHVRDHDYLQWRFQNPFRRYGFLYCEQAGVLEGYLVLGESTEEMADPAELHIVDWEGTSVRALSRLLEAARHVARRGGLSAWSSTLSEEKLTLLAQHGFQAQAEEHDASHQVPALLVRSVRTERPASEWTLAGRRLVDLTDWDVRMLYSMHG